MNIVFLLIDSREGGMGGEGMVETELLHYNSQAILFAFLRHSQPKNNEFWKSEASLVEFGHFLKKN